MHNMNTYITAIVSKWKRDGMTAKAFNALVKAKLDTTLHASVDETLKQAVAESGLPASGGLCHAAAMADALIEAGVIDGENQDAVKHAVWVLVATENASAWAQRAGLRVSGKDSAEDLANEYA